MKKILPYILISLIIVNLFAPFSVGVNSANKIPELKKSVAEADYTGIVLHTSATNTDTSITVKIILDWYIGNNDSTEKAVAILQKADGTGDMVEQDFKMDTDVAGTAAYQKTNPNQAEPYTQQTGTVTFPSLLPSTVYKVKIQARQNLSGWSAPITVGLNYLTGGSNSDMAEYTLTATTNTAGDKTQTSIISNQTTLSPDQGTVNLDKIMPVCGIGGSSLISSALGVNGTVAGCAAQLLYYVLFVPTSYLFALTGKFFDFTFGYSVNDASYRSGFVLGGWKIIRDFANIFFIFVMLYIAFSTILSLHGFKTKEMIINVVIIGLLINFSLFATQVIIDSSNILARVFYNSNSIKITKNGANCNTDSSGSGCLTLGQGTGVGLNGEIPLSAALVNKINPQNLIINGITKVEVTDTVSGQKSSSNKNSGVGVGAFILITLLAVAVNIVGLIVFLSVGLIFVTRVIGLWLAMIVVPLTFFSYTVPAMKDIDMIGWKKWWPETLKLAFLAPVFIFFLYLIIQFLNTGLDLVSADQQTGLAFIVATVVPFAFIMILLTKAKSIASKMSGEMGQGITRGIATVGGLALGGVALGTAFAGRKLIGGGLASASRTENSIHYAEQKIAFNKKLEEWKENGGAKKGIKKPTWEDHRKQNNVKNDIVTRIGGNLNAKQKQVGEVDHARHEMDETKKKAGLEGIEDYRLSGADKEKMQQVFTKDKRSDIERDLRDGTSNLIDDKGNNLGKIGESGFKSVNRDEIISKIKKESDYNVDGNGELTDAAKKKVEDELNVKFNAVINASVKKEGEGRFTKIEHESKEKVGILDRGFANANKSSYDVRNISKSKSDSREGLTTKMLTGLTAGIALGIRSGLKGAGVNHGAGQGDFMKDLSNTINDALKSMKVDVKVDASSHSSAKADTSHGGGHH